MPTLSWINDTQARQEASKVPFHLLEKVRSYGDPNSKNILVQGDNLLALKALLPFYRGKVKCIYIDPPYNTGNAFEHYDDNLEHSQWLSLMYSRLVLLRDFLTEDGFFCCQVDDQEGFYIKILLDEIFGRNNYLTTFYIQVRYSNKTLAEDSDYQKVIEQCHVYAKNKFLAKVNRPKEQYSIEKFCWEIEENKPEKIIELGGKKVEIFLPDQYKIRKIDPCIHGLKETWATGSLARVKASAGEFFELYLSDRKEIDGLGCLYKVYGIGADGLGYRYITGPKKITANKGKFYSGIPLERLEELNNGGSFKELPITNFLDLAGAFGNCRLEGNASFTGGKKPEILINKILSYFSNPNDWVMDSFLGSGTTAAVAHKMNRNYIGIEIGNHAITHCVPRLNGVINGDQTGISKDIGWQGGGGFTFYKLGETVFDEMGIINPKVNFKTLAAYVWQKETNSPTECQFCPLLGEYQGKSIFLLYNGILGDKRPRAGNVLNKTVLKELLKNYPTDNEKIIYGDACFGISNEELRAHKITFKQIPYDLGM